MKKKLFLPLFTRKYLPLYEKYSGIHTKSKIIPTVVPEKKLFNYPTDNVYCILLKSLNKNKLNSCNY